MAGYTRQSVADIIANAVIKAAPVNVEFNAIRDAFNASTGHKHDGTSAEGAYIPLIADPSATNKVVIDTANNRISFYNEVSSTAVEQIRLEDGVLKPVTDDDIDLGASGAEFKDLYIDGIGYIDSVVITGGTIDDTVIGGNTPAAGTFTSVVATTADINGGTIDGSTIGGSTPAAATFTSATATTVDINGGNIDGTTIGATTPAAADFTTMDTTGNASVGGTFAVTGTSTFTGAMSAGSLTTTGNSTHATVDINGGAIDGTIIGASSAAAGSFTTVTTSGQATLASADINGGTIDGAVIGGASAQAITGTTITANTGFTGGLTGNVTGNVTGNLTGDVTGDVTGDLTGNVTASTGTTTLNDLVVNGTVDFTSTALLNVSDPTLAQHAATKNYVDTNDALKLNLTGGTMSGDITMGGNTVTGLGTPSASSDAATKGYVDAEVTALVDAAPGTLDTLNELAAALGDDPAFATTVTNSIATKLPLAGGTMTGDITMGANAVTSTATPVTADELTRKGYVDTQDALKLDLAGGTMSGAIAMGTSKITGLGDPTASQDAATKAYVDTQDATKLNLSGGTMTGAIDMGANKITTTYTPTDNADLTTKTYVDGILGSATSAAASAAAAATSETNAATSETNASNSAAAAAASYDDFDDRYLGAKASAPTVDNDGDALVTGALYWNSTSDELYVWNGSAWEQGSFTAGSLLSNVVEDTTPQLGGDLDTNGNNVTFGDNDKAIFGAGSDLQIYHTGAFSYVQDTGTGNLILDTNGSSIALTYNDAEYLASFVANGPATLFYDNASKLATTSTGIDVTGTVTADGLTVGAANFAQNAIIKTQVEGSDVGNYDSGIQMRSHNDDFGGTIALESRSGTNDVVAFKYHNNSASGVRAMAIDATNGDISFYEDTGTTPKFFWDASAESLGIGTSSPVSPLHINVGTNQNLRVFSASSTPTLGSLNDANSAYAALGYTGSQHEFRIGTSEAMRIDSSGNVGIGTSSPSAKLDVNGVTLSDAVQEGYTSLSGTTPSIDADTAGSFALTTSGNTTFTFASVTSGRSVGFVLKLTAGGSHTITWPSSVDWAGGTAPDAPASGETDVLVFYTVDGGTTWYGALAIDAAA